MELMNVEHSYRLDFKLSSFDLGFGQDFLDLRHFTLFTCVIFEDFRSTHFEAFNPLELLLGCLKLGGQLCSEEQKHSDVIRWV